MTLKIQQTKAIIVKWSYIQPRNLCIKGHNQQSKKVAYKGNIKWERIFANHISDKE